MADNIHAQHRERLRNRYLNSDQQGFADHELLELLLFYSIPRRNTNDIAHELLNKFGSLEKVMSARVEELIQVDGIGMNSAILIKTVFDMHNRVLKNFDKSETFVTYEQIGDYFLKFFKHINVETMILLLFDRKGRIHRTVTVASGDCTSAVVDMKTMLSSLISVSAYSAAIAHNHPNGCLEFSFDDKFATIQIEEIFKTMGIKFIDHYVIAENKYLGIKHSDCTYGS